MGHINLAAPVAHVWFFKGAPSKISLILDLAPRSIEQVIYFARYLVIAVDEEKRKKRLAKIQEALKIKLGEIKESYGELKGLIKKDAKSEKEKIEKKIKDKEQAQLAISEVELDSRKKETALAEEEKQSTRE